jgi:hypothetical protein
MSTAMAHPPRRGRPRNAAAARSLPAGARSQCPSCGTARYRCTTSDGSVVVLDPVPREGGRFLVNPYTCTVVATRTSAQGRGAGFVEHRAVCFGATPAPRSA